MRNKKREIKGIVAINGELYKEGKSSFEGIKDIKLDLFKVKKLFAANMFLKSLKIYN